MTPPTSDRSWDERYEQDDPETMPWFHPALDPEIEVALERWLPDPSRVLDLGTGPGTQAIELARHGHRVTGTDVAPAAIRKAAERAAAEGIDVVFCVDDVLASGLVERFDLVVDRGCFHVFEPQLRSAYVQALSRLLDPGGLLFLKTFSYLEPGEFGPQRIRPEEIEATFGEHFELQSVEHCVYQGNKHPLPRALFFVLRRAPRTAPAQSTRVEEGER